MMALAVPVSQGHVAWVSPEDYPRVTPYTWYVFRVDGLPKYAQTKMRINGKRQTVLLHRFILNAGHGIEVDHVNGDGFNCTRRNMRPASRSENARNGRAHRDGRSRFRGVYLADGKWVAAIRYDGHNRRLGSFDTEEAAAAAYDRAALAHHGRFARPNNPASRHDPAT